MMEIQKEYKEKIYENMKKTDIKEIVQNINIFL